MEENNKKKLSYEDLENVAHQLSEQNRQLVAKLQEANLINMFKRLDYLFKILEKNTFFKESFVTKCVDEITDLMTLPEQEPNNKVDGQKS